MIDFKLLDVYGSISNALHFPSQTFRREGEMISMILQYGTGQSVLKTG
jgi:hypothetical protein